MRSIAVVTTFNESGLKKYGQRMIDTYILNWPSEVVLYVYAEKCTPETHGAKNVIVLDADSVLTDLQLFKNKWKHDPKANGKCPWPERRPRDHHKTFKWDAVRFSNKVYSVFHCASTSDVDILLWMDADSVCHSKITVDDLDNLIPTHIDICYLGRENKWSECGLYSMNLKTEATTLFLKEFKRVYDDAENGIFKMEEWHDSFVFDEVLKRINLKKLNWSAGLIKGEGHPLINSAWGAYLDHLKGGRKDVGFSKTSDLILERTETYWKNK